VGLAHLEKAASTIPTARLKISWEPFFLNPSTAIPEEGEDLAQHIAKKYGPEMARRFSSPDNPLSAAGRKVGINFNANRKVISTLRCHVAVEYVNQTFSIDKGDALMRVLFKKYFEEGINVNQNNNLLDACAEALGSDFDREKLVEILQDDSRGLNVKEKDRAFKTKMRVSGVPFFIIGKNSFSGAQPVELLLEVLNEALANNN